MFKVLTKIFNWLLGGNLDKLADAVAGTGGYCE